jgi:hypothetical protein
MTEMIQRLRFDQIKERTKDAFWIFTIRRDIFFLSEWCYDLALKRTILRYIDDCTCWLDFHPNLSRLDPTSIFSIAFLFSRYHDWMNWRSVSVSLRRRMYLGKASAVIATSTYNQSMIALQCSFRSTSSSIQCVNSPPQSHSRHLDCGCPLSRASAAHIHSRMVFAKRT